MDKKKWEELKKLKPSKPEAAWQSQKRGTYIKAKHGVIRAALEKEQDKELKKEKK